MKVIGFEPKHLMRGVAQSVARKKKARAIVSWMVTSKGLRFLIRAKKGMTNVTSMKPTNNAKKASTVLLLKNAVSGI